jgi:hypothetical protein
VERNKGLWIIAAYLFLAVYLLPMFPHGGAADELGHWATAASLVEKSSFEIGWTAGLIGPNADSANVGDSVYSTKPPGTAILAAPIYALMRTVVGQPDASNIRISWAAMRFFVSTLPLLLLGMWLYSRDTDELSLAALFFASPVFVCSLLFFSHVLAGVLVYIAFRVIYDARRIFLRNCFLAGAICGFAFTSELTALVPAIALAGGLRFTDRRDRVRNLLFFAAGAAPFAVALLAYSQAIFGSPFALFHASDGISADLARGIGIPTPSSLYLLLFSPSRGLLFFAPVLTLSLVAFLTSRELKTLRHRVKTAAVVLTVIALGGLYSARGGWAFGPLPIVIIVPLLLDSFFDGEIYETSNIWQGFLFAISFFLCTVPALTFPFAPPEFKYPHNSFWGSFLWDENWFVPNVANVLGAPSAWWTMVPAVAALAVVMYVVWRYARRPLRFFCGAIAGCAIVIGYLMLPNLDSAENRFRRATIAETHFGSSDRLERFRATVAPERMSAAEWRIADTRALAPDDFPYLATRERSASPTAELTRAAALRQIGDAAGAEAVLRNGRSVFPFARCRFATELALLIQASGRREDAIGELLGVGELAGPNAHPDCLRSQFLLGLLYRETGRTDLADRVFGLFLANTDRSSDEEIKRLRRQLGRP